MAREGMVLQIVTLNGLADPYLFGLSSGASAGAIAMIVFFGDQFGVMTAFTGAITGGGLATFFLMTLLFSQLRHRPFAAPGRLILGGVAISFLFTTCADLWFMRGIGIRRNRSYSGQWEFFRSGLADTPLCPERHRDPVSLPENQSPAP